MKRNRYILAAALALALTLGACGNTDDSSKAEVTPAGSTASAADNGESSVPSESTDDAAGESTGQDESEDADESEAPQPDTEPDMTLHEFQLTQIDDSFRFNDEYSFRELVQKGLANVYSEGEAIALVPAEGTAGMTYFEFWHTEDSGRNWSKSETPVGLLSGPGVFFGTDDGKLGALVKPGAYDGNSLVLTVVGIGEDLEPVIAENSEWANGITLSDGTALADCTADLGLEAYYFGGSSIRVVLTDKETDETVFDGVIEYDPETLAIKD